MRVPLPLFPLLTAESTVFSWGNGESGKLWNYMYYHECTLKCTWDSNLDGYEVSLSSIEYPLPPSNTHTHTRSLPGQLGLGTMDSHPSPQPVFLPEGHTPRQACCGPDCSLLITDHGQLLATGSNRLGSETLQNSIYNLCSLVSEFDSFGEFEESQVL